MRVLLSSIVAAIVLAVGAVFILRSVQEPVYEAYPSPSVRLDDPGANLVGKDWSGDPKVRPEDRRAVTADSKAGATN